MTEHNVKSNAAIHIREVNRTYLDASGIAVNALQNVSLDINAGEFISFIGPSGCGKTTLMRLIAGLDRPQAGEVYIDDERIETTDYKRGYVFQQANLFPWETIENNIASGLKARKVYKKRKHEVKEYLKLTGLEGFERSYPHQISGGMAQRASLARALINDPEVLLLDEPLGALDAFTRMDLQGKLLELWKQKGTTMILVTHDVDEAVFLSDRIVIMTPRPGKIEEVVNVDLPRPRARNHP
ncbi:MAG TPA: ABC transporter ATP-binding protein, partial [Desulfobacteria bacterium]|nr:ABC transporter ATP-binding protein [Desulfobacteria bacterium]